MLNHSSKTFRYLTFIAYFAITNIATTKKSFSWTLSRNNKTSKILYY